MGERPQPFENFAWRSLCHMIPLRLHLRSCQCLCQLGLIKSMLVAWKEGGENARAVERNNNKKEWQGI